MKSVHEEINKLNIEKNELISQNKNEFKNSEANTISKISDCMSLLHTKLSQEQAIRIIKNNSELYDRTIEKYMNSFKYQFDSKMNDFQQKINLNLSHTSDNWSQMKESLSSIQIDLNNKIAKSEIDQIDEKFVVLRQDFTKELNLFNKTLNNFEIQICDMRALQVQLIAGIQFGQNAF